MGDNENRQKGWYDNMSEMYEDDDVIELTDEDGNEVKFEYLDVVEYNGKEFVVLLPIEQPEDSEGEVVILEISTDSEGEEEFLPVEDDDELDEVFAIFKERMQDEFEFANDDDDDDEDDDEEEDDEE